MLMRISLSHSHLTAVNPAHKRIERATDYVGPLSTTGKDVVVAVIDSGISKHPDVVDNIAVAVAFQKDRAPSADEWGHGTAVAGVIVGNGKSSNGEVVGLAPGAKLINLPVFTKQANEDGLAGLRMYNALNWVVDNKDRFGIRVVNISGGMQAALSPDDQNGQLQTFLDPLDSAIKRAVEAGLVIVTAAGNTGPGPGSIMTSPAHHPDVITVGSLDTNGTPDDTSDDFVAEHSSRGPGPMGNVKPDLVAPGTAITLAAAPECDILKNNQALNTAYEPAKALLMAPDDALIGSAFQAIASQQMSSTLFAKALPELARLLPERLKLTLQSVPAEAQPLMALRLAAGLAGKGVLDTEGQPFKAAAAALRSALEKAAPAAVLQTESGATAYMVQDGTSFAAPIVTSVIAHMLEVNSKLTPAQIKDILKSTARPVSGADQYSAGAGALNAQAAIAKARELAGLM